MHVTGHATQIPGFLYLYFTIVAKTRQVLVTFYKVMEIRLKSCPNLSNMNFFIETRKYYFVLQQI